jgi:hypothetical protein
LFWVNLLETEEDALIDAIRGFFAFLDEGADIREVED